MSKPTNSVNLHFLYVILPMTLRVILIFLSSSPPPLLSSRSVADELQSLAAPRPSSTSRSPAVAAACRVGARDGAPPGAVHEHAVLAEGVHLLPPHGPIRHLMERVHAYLVHLCANPTIAFLALIDGREDPFLLDPIFRVLSLTFHAPGRKRRPVPA